MKKFQLLFICVILVFPVAFLNSQEVEQKTQEKKQGHTNVSKFRQLKQELPTPNNQHTASGAPGYEYTQQQVDYKMNITIDDDTQKLYGEEIVTYHNNSKDQLEYLWVQLDQNVRSPDSKSRDIQQSSIGEGTYNGPITFTGRYLKKPFAGGFHLDYVNDENGKALSHTIMEQ